MINLNTNIILISLKNNGRNILIKRQEITWTMVTKQTKEEIFLKHGFK